MKKDYNLRSNKCATQDSDSDSDYETEETESEFVTESESESENESDDPLSVNITFTIANNEETESMVVSKFSRDLPVPHHDLKYVQRVV